MIHISIIIFAYAAYPASYRLFIRKLNEKYQYFHFLCTLIYTFYLANKFKNQIHQQPLYIICLPFSADPVLFFSIIAVNTIIQPILVKLKQNNEQYKTNNTTQNIINLDQEIAPSDNNRNTI